MAKRRANGEGSTAKLSKNFLDLKLAVGGIFMPIAQVVIPYISLAIQWITKLAQTIANFVQAVTGKGGFTAMAGDTANVADSFSGVGGAALDAGDAVAKGAKKARGALAGFDEINNIQLPDASGGAGSALSGVDGASMPEIGNLDFSDSVIPPDMAWIDEIRKRFEALNPVIDSAKQIVSSFVDGFNKKANEIDLNPIENFKNIGANLWNGIKKGLAKVNFGAITDNLSLVAGGLGEIIANGLKSAGVIAEAASKTIGTAIEWGIAIGGKGFEIVTQAGAKFITDNKEKIMAWQTETANTMAKVCRDSDRPLGTKITDGQSDII